jgi:hypothetical protein
MVVRAKLRKASAIIKNPFQPLDRHHAYHFLSIFSDGVIFSSPITQFRSLPISAHQFDRDAIPLKQLMFSNFLPI